jgi:hypothetical protein
MVKMRSPKVLWDYCLELSSKIRSVTAHNLYLPTERASPRNVDEDR